MRRSKGIWRFTRFRPENRLKISGFLVPSKRKPRTPLLVAYECFDLFTGPTGVKIDADRKSIAYRFHYRAPERTLVLKEIDEAHKRILGLLSTIDGLVFR